MDFTFDDNRLINSYLAMLDTEMTNEQRAKLWEFAKEYYPEMASKLQEQFQNAKKEDDQRQEDRLTGATFMFLTMLNSVVPETVVVSVTAKPKTYKANFPSFGFLRRL